MPQNWDLTTLPNGLRVVTQAVPTAQSAAITIFAGVGSRAEDRRVNGVSHFLEHMLFKGTPTRPNAILISEAVEGAGGTLNAFTSREMTCYWDLVPYDRFETGLEILCDMYVNALLDEAEIDRERNVVQQEIKRAKDQPAAWASELVTQAVFGDQPLGWPIAGTEETVNQITRSDQLEHVTSWYCPNNTVVSIAGQIQHEAVVASIGRLLGQMTRRPLPPVPPVKEQIAEPHIRVEHRDTTQANLQIGMYGVKWSDPDRYTVGILTTILGRGMSSRLFKEVRERRGLAYSVGAGHQRHKDCGFLSISAGVSPENLAEAVQVSLTELTKLRDEPVRVEELTKAKDFSAGSFRLGLESTMAIAQRNGEGLLMAGEIEPVEEVVERLQSVTAADVQRAARRLFRDDNLALSVVGPAPPEDTLANALRLS